MSHEQWINLPRESKYVEDEVKSKKRLDFVRIKVKFKKAKLAGYKLLIKCMGGSEFENYETEEKARNSNFIVKGMPGVLTNDGKTEMEYTYDLHLNAAGGNEYQIVADHKGKEVSTSLTVETRRKLFYQVLQMRGVPSAPTTDMENAYWEPDKKFFIKLKKEGADTPMDYIKCLDGYNYRDFWKAAGTAFTLGDDKPYAFAIAFVDFAPTREYQEFELDANASLMSKVKSWFTGALVMTVDLPEYLYYELEDDWDKNQGWLNGVSMWFESTGNPVVKTAISIKKEHVQPSGPAAGGEGGRKQVKITLPTSAIHAVGNSAGGQLKVELRVWCVMGFSGGFAYNAVNLIAIATRAWWQSSHSISGATYVLNHEVGHKVGMVAHGDREVEKTATSIPEYASQLYKRSRLPNGHGKLYGEMRGTNDKGHMGPHCETGGSLSYDSATDEWSGTPGCVMFGATGTAESASPETFCDACAELVRKLDLSGDTLEVLGFKYSVDEWKKIP